MPRQSLDSERPIMARSICSEPSYNRMSVYSASPSFTSTNSTETANGMAEIKELAQGLDRLKDKRLEQQRYTASAQKADDLSKLALGAKLERALGRRMTQQDAVMRVKPKKPKNSLDEKPIFEKRAMSTTSA